MLQDTNYDNFAEAYSTENETSLINGFYERPAMLNLAGDVGGRQILDAGCGSGPLAKALSDRGATITGFDSSEAMIGLARKRLGEETELLVADLGQPLPFAEDTFDDVVASLVFHYLEDWVSPLQEIRRVLRPGGRLIMSVNHPILYPLTTPGSDYFKTTRYSDEHTFNGQPATLTYWHRPLHAMTECVQQGRVPDRGHQRTTVLCRCTRGNHPTTFQRQGIVLELYFLCAARKVVASPASVRRQAARYPLACRFHQVAPGLSIRASRRPAEHAQGNGAPGPAIEPEAPLPDTRT